MRGPRALITKKNTFCIVQSNAASENTPNSLTLTLTQVHWKRVHRGQQGHNKVTEKTNYSRSTYKPMVQ